MALLVRLVLKKSDEDTMKALWASHTKEEIIDGIRLVTLVFKVADIIFTLSTHALIKKMFIW